MYSELLLLLPLALMVGGAVWVVQNPVGTSRSDASAPESSIFTEK